MKKIIIITVLVAIGLFYATSISLAADVSYNFNNEFQYFLYEDTSRDSLIDRMETSIGIGNLTLGFLMETREPLPKPSDADRKIGYLHLRKRYAIYAKDDFSIRVGDFPILVGRGLSVNLFRDDNLPIDNEPEGVKLSYQGDYGNVTLFSGNIKKRVAPISSQDLSYELDDTKNHIIRGAEIVTKPFKHLKVHPILEPVELGLQYTRFRGLEEQNNGESLEYRRHMGGMSLGYGNDYFDMYTEFVGGEQRRQLLDANGVALVTVSESDTLQALYGVLNAYWGDFTVTGEFKDYKGLNFVDDQGKPYNNPPTAITEHTSRLLGRYQYTLDMDNERGYRGELAYTLGFDTEIILDYTKTTDREGETDLFTETFVEAQHHLDNLTLHGLVAMHENNRGGDETGERTGGWLKGSYVFDSGKSLTVLGEYLTTKAKEGEEDDLAEQAYTIAYSGAPSWTAMVNFETISVEEDGKDNWVSFELQYSFWENHFLRVFYGARRWGLNCAGGVCSLQPEFEGLEVQLISSF